MIKKISQGVAHKVPADLREALLSHPKVLSLWETLTPLARNEWICWIISVKNETTRKEHLARALGDLAAGKRRPCCWIGCVHRTDKPMSASQKYILGKRSEKK